ncbi:MAG: hypothetical protein K8T90_15655 [Planctomycetes bacterium]|nr:hypothetical protein [Planctomycetota bacterium]
MRLNIVFALVGLSIPATLSGCACVTNESVDRRGATLDPRSISIPRDPTDWSGRREAFESLAGDPTKQDLLSKFLHRQSFEAQLAQQPEATTVDVPLPTITVVDAVAAQSEFEQRLPKPEWNSAKVKDDLTPLDLDDLDGLRDRLHVDIHVRLTDPTTGRIVDNPLGDDPINPELRAWLLKKYGPVVYVPDDEGGGRPSSWFQREDKARAEAASREAEIREAKSREEAERAAEQKRRADRQLADAKTAEEKSAATAAATAAQAKIDRLTAEKKVAELEAKAAGAMKKDENLSKCSNYVADVSQQNSTPIPTGYANDQIKWMDRNWKSVSPEEAQKTANKGDLAIGGRESGKPGAGGHVFQVYPGEGHTGRDGKFYPNVVGGGAAAARSTGGMTADQIFKPAERAGIKYWVPKKP